jgi:hypothetical protein
MSSLIIWAQLHSIVTSALQRPQNQAVNNKNIALIFMSLAYEQLYVFV